MNVPNVGINGRNKYLDILDAAWQEHLIPRKLDAPTVISLFAGCGGSSLGYSMAGFRELLAVERNDNAVETFKANFPDVQVYHDDIAKLSVKQCLEMSELKAGQLDILDGSPPCQGFSTAGKRQLDDPRNSLAMEFIRLLRGLQPKVFIMENVSGLVKGKMKLVFAEIMKELKASDYKVKCQLMNTMYFNVPQSRQRLMWIGIRNDLDIEPSYPRTNNVIGCIRVDERLCKRSHKRYGDILQEADMPITTITKIGRHFWNDNMEFGDKSYAIISSYPESFIFVGSFTDKKERIGNSVPPLFMKAIAEHIRNNILVDMGLKAELIE